MSNTFLRTTCPGCLGDLAFPKGYCPNLYNGKCKTKYIEFMEWYIFFTDHFYFSVSKKEKLAYVYNKHKGERVLYFTIPDFEYEKLNEYSEYQRWIKLISLI